jgi:hypothetical protein
MTNSGSDKPNPNGSVQQKQHTIELGLDLVIQISNYITQNPSANLPVSVAVGILSKLQQAVNEAGLNTPLDDQKVGS